MIVNPVLIIGAPRSGTSMLQKVLRNHPAFWSLPSEGDMIWDQFCDPGLRGWDSEVLEADDVTDEDRERILELFEDYIQPATYWRPFERTNVIWGFRRVPALRKMMRATFSTMQPIITKLRGRSHPKRLLEKTTSNCFRLGYVDKVFPDAKIIYPIRDGRNTVNSLINSWRHPDRFFTYKVPAELHIEGYEHDRWKFVLPPGWRDYTDRSLAEVCAFQWRSCHEHMLAETAKEQYRGRVIQVRLEEFVADPKQQMARLAEFLDLEYDDYFKSAAADLPVVNSPDNDVSRDKWQGENRQLIEQVMPMITPMMERLGYEVK
jgi:hypothetical protein